MSQPLPTGNFKWMSNVEEITSVEENITKKIKKLARGKMHGYLLEVDVDYPDNLHDLHNDLPFLSEKIKIIKVEKLIPNLNNKKKYIINVKTLDQALKHGLILKKVHRAIRFDQSPWLEPYITHNTRLRTAATNDFEKDFFKLMNNSVFGKTMENIRNHKDIKLVTNEKNVSKECTEAKF